MSNSKTAESAGDLIRNEIADRIASHKKITTE